MSKNGPAVQILYWQDVRAEVRKQSPYISKLIDKMQPDHTLPLVLCSYHYNDLIVDNGTIQFPKSDNDGKIRQLLNYSDIPVGIALNKALEVFVNTENRIIPFKLFYPGTAFGVWEALDLPQTPFELRQDWQWSISAGTRSTFLLPKISNITAFNRMKKRRGLHQDIPNSLSEHASLFTEIVKADSIQDWQCQILYFTKPWMELRHNAALELRIHWFKSAWEQALNWINKVNYDFGWQQFLAILERKRLKPSNYVINTMKHLLAIGSGVIPGFKATGKSNLYLPIKTVQDCFITDYQLKDYTPTIMVPHRLQQSDNIDTVYYSLQHPTLPDRPPHEQSKITTMSELKQVKKLLDIYFESMQSKQPPKNKQADFYEHIKLSYHHCDHDIEGEILPTNNFADEDPDLISCVGEYSNNMFPYAAKFFRGCIKIKKL